VRPLTGITGGYSEASGKRRDKEINSTWPEVMTICSISLVSDRFLQGGGRWRRDGAPGQGNRQHLAEGDDNLLNFINLGSIPSRRRKMTVRRSS
jgi:hypothetical protein